MTEDERALLLLTAQLVLAVAMGRITDDDQSKLMDQLTGAIEKVALTKDPE